MPNTPTTGRRALHGLASLIAIITLLVGVPVFLWRTVGWPLPSTLPSWTQFSSAITHTEIPMGVLTKTLACIGWVAWLMLALSICVEVVAWASGRGARQLRAAGPFQPIARSLVASVAVLFTLSPVSSSFASASALQTSLSYASTAPTTQSWSRIEVVAPQPVPNTAEVPKVLTDAAPPEILRKQQTVGRHDTLWDLAERHLGTPYRWEEIWNLNRGETQIDGREFTDAHWIYPGWVLTMPADAVGVTETSVPPTTQTPSQPVDQPASQTSENTPAEQPAPEAEAPAPLSSTPVAPTMGTQAGSPAASGSSTSAPESEMSVNPGTAPSAPTTATPNAAETTTATDRPAITTRVAPTEPRFGSRVPWVAGGLCAAGLVALLDRLRRSQRTRRRGTPIHMPPADLAPLETGLRRSAAVNEDRCQLLDAALRAFAAGAFGNPAMAAPRLLAVRSYPDSVELLLDQPLEGAVLGFTPQSANRLWVTEPGLTVELLRRLADEVAAPYPALVTLGEVDGGDLLVDIETAGILCIHDGDQKPDDLFARISIEVSTSLWGDFFDIITVGDVADFAGFERNRRHPRIDDGLDALAATAREIDESLLVLGASSTVAPRVSYALGDGWTPSIFVSDQPLDQGQMERLRTIVGAGGRGVGALLMGNKPAGDWNLRCDTNSAHLDPVDLDITPLAMAPSHAGGIAELLGDAATGHLDPDEIEAKPIAVDPTEFEQTVTSQDAVPLAEDAAAVETDRRFPNEGSTNEPAPSAHPVPSEALTTIDEAHPVGAPPMVRVLGVVGIDNMEHEGRRKVVELIAYLALHPDGVSSDRLTEALWPDETPVSNTLSRNVCYARKALGLDADGNNHLPRISTEGRYRLGPHVRCDLLEFVELAKTARETDDEGTKVQLLSEALDLVRDKPFDSVVDYEWAWTENWTAVAETEIADAAVALADLHLRASRPEEALRASLKGSKGAPEDHRLRSNTDRLAGSVVPSPGIR